MKLRILYLAAAVAMIGLSVGCLYPEPGGRREQRHEERRDQRHDDRRDRDHDDRHDRMSGLPQ